MAIDTPYEGKKYLFFIDSSNTNGGPYDLVVCLTSNTYTRAANVIDASSKCGTYKFNGDKARTIAIAGQVIFVPGANKISEAELNTLFENDTPFSWRMGPETPVEGDVSYEGVNAIVSDLAIDAPKDGALGFTATIQVNGVPTQTIEPGS